VAPGPNTCWCGKRASTARAACLEAASARAPRAVSPTTTAGWPSAAVEGTAQGPQHSDAQVGADAGAVCWGTPQRPARAGGGRSTRRRFDPQGARPRWVALEVEGWTLRQRGVPRPTRRAGVLVRARPSFVAVGRGSRLKDTEGGGPPRGRGTAVDGRGALCGTASASKGEGKRRGRLEDDFLSRRLRREGRSSSPTRHVGAMYFALQRLHAPRPFFKLWRGAGPWSSLTVRASTQLGSTGDPPSPPLACG